MHGKSTNHGQSIHGNTDLGQTLRNTDFLTFSSNQMNGYYRFNVLQSGRHDHGQMYIDSCTKVSQRNEFYFFIPHVGSIVKHFFKNV